MNVHRLMRLAHATGFLLATIFLISFAANADTLYLKDGTVLKCKGTAYRDGQFTISLGNNASSRATIAAGDVDRIEFEATGGQTSAIYMKDGTVMRGRGAAYRDSQFTMNIGQAASRAIIDIADVQKIEVETGAGGTRSDASVEQSPNPKAASLGRGETRREQEPVKPDRQQPAPNTISGAQDSPRPRSAGEVIKSVNVSVLSRNGWNSSGVVIKTGDRVRITASGTITIDQARGTRCGPEGIDLADSKKLMEDKPTGALIGVIGTDNDEFIFVGKSVEFMAKRSGILFLSVNEGDLGDNNGSYAATIVVQPTAVASNP